MEGNLFLLCEQVGNWLIGLLADWLVANWRGKADGILLMAYSKLVDGNFGGRKSLGFENLLVFVNKMDCC